MPVFEIQGADGQVYEVDAPSQDAAVQAFTKFQPPTITPQATAPVSGGYSDAPEWTKPFTAFGTGAMDTMTFGFKDELGAALSSFGSKIAPWRDTITYDEALSKIRQDEKALAEQQPVANIAGQVAGAVGPMKALGKLGMLPSAGLTANAPLATRALVGGAEGAAMGGAYGFGSGEGFYDRTAGAVMNGALGGALGAAVPVVAQGVSSAYRNVMDRAAKAKVAQQAGVSPEVATLLTNVTNADQTLGPTGLANMQRAGNEAMFADAGPNAQQVLDTSIQRGGPGSVLARQRIDERVGRDAAAMTGALDTTLGQPEGILASQANIRTAARPGVNAAYQTANATPINYASPEGMAVEDVINRIPNRFKSQAIQRANEILAYEGTPNLQIMANIADDGSVTFREMPNVAQADAIKKALDAVARDGTDVTGKMSSEAAFASRMARDLRDSVASAVPEYGRALRTAADPLSRIEATRIGGSLLSGRVSRDEAVMALDGMTDAQRAAARQGVRSFIDDQMASVKTAFTDPNMDAREAAKAIKDLSSRANRDKLTALLGQAEANTLFDELDRVSQSFALKASVAQNSKTYARQATEQGINDMTAPGVIGTLAEGEPLNATKRIAQALTGRTPEAIRGRQDAIYSDVAEFLTRPANQAIPAFRAMQNFGGQIAANDATSMQIARMLGMGKNLVYPTTAITGQ